MILQYIEVNNFHDAVSVIIVGHSGVGKTCLLTMYIKGVVGQTIPTISVEFCTKEIQITNGPIVKVQLWDTAGTERYQSLAMNFYRKAYGILLLFDVTNRLSFISCKTYLEDVRNYSDKECLVYLVGNKIDLAEQREITTEEAQAYAKKENLIYIETSAISNIGVSQAFQSLIDGIYTVKKNDMQVHKETNGNNKNIKVKAVDKQSEGCCS